MLGHGGCNNHEIPLLLISVMYVEDIMQHHHKKHQLTFTMVDYILRTRDIFHLVYFEKWNQNTITLLWSK
jgi:hypothetical protein